MKQAFFSLTLVSLAALSLQAQTLDHYLEITDVTMHQLARNQDVIVNYNLKNNGEPAYVLLDIRTNDVSIGLDKIKTVSGDISLPTSRPVSNTTTNKTIVWKAREDWRGNLATNAEAHVLACYTNGSGLAYFPGVYMVIDVSGGTNATDFPVSYTFAAPDPEDAACTSNHIWLKRIEAQTFTMGSPANEPGRTFNTDYGTTDYEAQHKVTLSKPFFAGVFAVTREQYRLVTGITPSGMGGRAPLYRCPVNMVSWLDIRGSNLGANWPATNAVDATSFMGILHAKAGFATFDLPTEAQWECACRAGTTTAWNNGTGITGTDSQGSGLDTNVSLLGWYKANAGSDYLNVFPVGKKLKNAWGLYDMHGNQNEWCLDAGLADYGTAACTDPYGAKSGTARIYRGGAVAEWTVYNLRSAARRINAQAFQHARIGFRLFLTLED